MIPLYAPIEYNNNNPWHNFVRCFFERKKDVKNIMFTRPRQT